MGNAIASIEESAVTWREAKPGETVEHFNPTLAVAALMANGVVILAGRFTVTYGPGWKQTGYCTLVVRCDDVFAWATPDEVSLPYNDVEALYAAWRQHEKLGPAKWCCIKRRMQPQHAVEKAMREAGLWDDDLEGLPSNTRDDEVHARLSMLGTITKKW